MIISLFALIAWAAIIAFSIIPKGLSVTENIIAFFCISILEINISTVTSLNLKLVEYSSDLKKYLGLLIDRSIISPLCILIFINLLVYFKERLKKISAAAITLLILVLIQLLLVWTGTKVYKEWNAAYDVLAALFSMIFSTFLALGLKKIK